MPINNHLGVSLLGENAFGVNGSPKADEALCPAVLCTTTWRYYKVTPMKKLFQGNQNISLFPSTGEEIGQGIL